MFFLLLRVRRRWSGKSLSFHHKLLVQPAPHRSHSSSPKRPDASEERIKLDIQRFEKLQRSLSFISKQLKIQLQRKTLLLGSDQPSGLASCANRTVMLIRFLLRPQIHGPQ